MYFRDLGVAYSEDGSTTMWIGVTTHKNVLGYMILVYAMYFANNLLVTWKSRKGVIDFVFLMMMLWLIVGTSESKGSSTSLSALSLGLIVLLAAHWKASNLMKLRKIIFSIVLALCFLTAISQALGGSFLEVVTSSMGRDVTLTGRTEIWSVALGVGPGNPLFGRGYGSFWIGETANQVWDNLTYHTHFLQSHNGYIDIYLELGALGLILLAGLIRSAWKNIGVTLRSNIEYGMYRMAFLLAILMHNLTESSYGRPNHLLWFMFLLSCVYVTASFEHRGLRDKPRSYTKVR
jgi:O-antigen ligase